MRSILGIRHHGPGSARSVRMELEKLRPDCVLVEGPPDADALIALAADPQMTPPIALLLYLPDNPQKAVYYPFAEFSPEWQAIQYALKNKIPVRFMDLEQKYQLPVISEQLSVEKDLTPETRKPDTPPFDPFAIIAEAAGYSDGERWWEHFVEQRHESGDVFTGILELMTALRAEAEKMGQIEPRDLIREAAMRTIIRAAQAEGRQNIAILCGAWHAPALANLDAAKADENLLKNAAKAAAQFMEAPAGAAPESASADFHALRRDFNPRRGQVLVASTFVPWTYDRLARRSGYGAGIDSPGWYEHLWQTENHLVETWMVKVAQLMRQEDLGISPAHAIEATRLAETLAALRGRPLPGLPELDEAIQSIFCFGDDAPMRLIREKLIVGQRMGHVPPGAPTVPLQRDISAAQKRARLEPSASPENLDLDLRKPLLLERSHLLHRLNLLGIPWGKLQTTHGAKGTFHELWQIEWKPEFAVSIIEASLWGNTVLEAATAKVTAEAARAAELPALTRLVEAAFLADLAESIPSLMERLQRLAAASADIPHLMDALPPLINVTRYGNVRQTDTALVRHVVDELITRICIGLPAACSALDDAAAEEMFERIKAVNGGMFLLTDNPLTPASPKGRWADSLHPEGEGQGMMADPPLPLGEGPRVAPPAPAWTRTLTLLAAPQTGHGLTRGLACRLIYDAHADADTANRMSLALSPGTPAAESAAWVQGFLHSGGQALIHDPALWHLLDDWVLSLPESLFTALLPLLRRAFSTFPAPERRQIGELAKTGGRITSVAGEMELDPVRAEKALTLVSLILDV